jgi:DNA polymerase III subunit gamma/tau
VGSIHKQTGAEYVGGEKMSLANLLRPRCIADVKGQEQVTDVLAAQIRDNRLAQCMIYAGKYGCGKTSVARVIAATVTCDHPHENGDPCGLCPSCKALMMNGSSANVLELDAATYRGIDAVRGVIEQAQIPPQGLARKKVIILDECHMLTVEASNALLKTLEEPPEWCMFILCTTEESRILPTIKSRCQIFHFEPIREETMAETVTKVLEEQGIAYEERVPRVIAHLAHGSFRDALSSLEQCICSLGAEEQLSVKAVSAIKGIASMDIAYSILCACIDGDISSIVSVIMQTRCDGTAALSFVDALCEMLLDALCFASGMDEDNGYDLSFLEYRDITFLCELIGALGEQRGKLSSYGDPYIQVIAAIVKMISTSLMPDEMEERECMAKVRTEQVPVQNGTERFEAPNASDQELPDGFKPLEDGMEDPFAVNADEFFGTSSESARQGKGHELSGSLNKEQDSSGACPKETTGSETDQTSAYGFTGFSGLGF